MATRIDHTNCSHPRTPKGRAACREDRAQVTSTVTATDLGLSTVTTPKPPVKSVAKANPVTKVTNVSDLPMPKLTPAQLDSPIIKSMLRKPVK